MKELDFILEKGKEYTEYFNNNDSLIQALNEISKEELQIIYQDYKYFLINKFLPVNTLRAKIAEDLLKGKTITKEYVEEVKEKIRNKDVSFFENEKATEDFKNSFLKYKTITKRGVFTNWQNYFRIFYPFFYFEKTKTKTNDFLKLISEKIIDDLSLIDYKYHTVDFEGPNNFGSNYCWLAVFPRVKKDHNNAYQFFVQISSILEGGMIAGSYLNDKESKNIEIAKDYNELIKILKNHKEEIILKNNKKRNYFKIAPGRDAVEWEDFKNNNYISVDYDNLISESLDNFETKEEFNIACGLKANSGSNMTQSMWQLKNANIGDVVFASKGVNTCLGIGIITSEYLFEKMDNISYHKRNVEWITDKTFTYKEKSFKKQKVLFRRDSFSTTYAYKFIINEYIKLYPELKEVFIEKGILDNVKKETTLFEKLISNKEDQKIVCNFLKDSINYISEKNNNNWEITQKKDSNIIRLNVGRCYAFDIMEEKMMILLDPENTDESLKSSAGNNLKEDDEFKVITKIVYQLFCDVNFLKENETDIRKAHNGFLDIVNETSNSTPYYIHYSHEFIEEINKKFELNINHPDYYKQGDNPPINPPLKKTNPQYTLEECRKDTGIDLNRLQTWKKALLRKKQIVFYGPPGTGKTFIAKKIANHLLSENSGKCEIIQFHPSYSYEDFIEGIRPKADTNGTLTYPVKSGRFVEFCKEAESSEDPYIMIVDEINRANLSRVFGELMFLLEYRDEKIKLAVSGKDFSIPENVYLIGTMNTADRSIALVDHALRRRFAFLKLYPEMKVINNFNYNNFNPEKITELLKKLNSKIEDNYQVGISFFLRKNLHLEIEDIWKLEIEPYLEEYFFDDKDNLENFRWDKIKDELFD